MTKESSAFGSIQLHSEPKCENESSLVPTCQELSLT